MMQNKKNRIAVFGASGRMGRAIVEQIKKCTRTALAVSVDKSNLKDLDKSKADTVIDFSSPNGTVEISRWCGKNKIPLVVGTTGLTSAQGSALKKIAEKIPVFVAPNMSSGVYAFAESLRSFLKVFKEGEVFIEETHHKNKKDAPSGTAKFLYEVLKEAAFANVKVRPPTSVRAGEVFGIHRVSFFSEGEFVTFEHQATGRAIFAKGAVEAAIWLARQKPGFYQMKDMYK
jgi:4-hydroxy-tetrahydrodipicolinate reductase